MDMPLDRVAAAGLLVVGLLSIRALGGEAMATKTLPAGPPPVERPAMVEVFAGSSEYRLAGEFSAAGRSVTAPTIRYRLEGVLEVMRHQVTVGEYRRCVAAGACPKLVADAEQGADFPAVGVSFLDAAAYAAWLSAETGESYRLPTDAEWAYAAGGRFRDDGAGAADDPADPSKAWLTRYQREAEARPDSRPRPVGGFGANEHGLLDLAGNVWEWTSTCFERRRLDESGASAPLVNCGVRVVEGEHRSYVPDFIRDARAGGCATGTPPSHLGFRLVRERGGSLAPVAAVAEAQR
jgi:formylglycine-generating enzyme required for sulfatase activity